VLSSHELLLTKKFARPRTAPDDYDPSTDMISKAEFRLGEDGHVKELGMILDGDMGERKIWFRKAAVDQSREAELDASPASSTNGAETFETPSGAGAWPQPLFQVRMKMPIFFE